MDWNVSYVFNEENNSDSEDELDCKCYEQRIKKYVESVYVVGLFLWFLLVFILDLYEEDIIVWIFIFLPPVVYLINLINVEDVNQKVERQMFKGNFLSFGFLITIILLNWNSPLENADKSKFLQLLVVAFILILISLIDIWVSIKNQSIVKHIKTVLHTAALSLLGLALYLYYQFYSKACTDCKALKLF